jgi:hypothetical protein
MPALGRDGEGAQQRQLACQPESVVGALLRTADVVGPALLARRLLGCGDRGGALRGAVSPNQARAA